MKFSKCESIKMTMFWKRLHLIWFLLIRVRHLWMAFLLKQRPLATHFSKQHQNLITCILTHHHHPVIFNIFIRKFRLITEIHSDSLYEMITTPIPIASLVEDTPPNFLTEVENVSYYLVYYLVIYSLSQKSRVASFSFVRSRLIN